MSDLLAALLGAACGFVLGLTGAGGALFALPLLVYVLKVPAADAALIALLAAGAMAAFGAALSLRSRNLAWRPGLLFSAAAIPLAPAGIAAHHHVPEPLLLAGFGLLLLGIAAYMLRTRTAQTGEAQPHAIKLMALGAGTGWLSGFFGVGGGFLIVPALTAFAGVPLKQAATTSLLIIALISGSAIGIDLVSGHHVAWSVALPFVAGGLAGTAAGRWQSSNMDANRLQHAFAALLGLTGLSMLALQLRGWLT